MKLSNTRHREAGFTIAELLVAMTVTLVMIGLTSALLAGSFSIRTRENQRTEALADTQRGLNLMTREIANSGYALTDNGIVAADSGIDSIRVRANLNASLGETTSNAATDRDEDIKYFLFTDDVLNSSYIVRLDVNTTAQQMILANRVDALKLHYYADKVTYPSGDCDIDTSNVLDASGNPVGEVAKAAAKYVVMTICVNLPAVSSPGAPGYQPSSKVQLTSDIALRNADLFSY
jgi:Tfp pilus assembly protein PilW